MTKAQYERYRDLEMQKKAIDDEIKKLQDLINIAETDSPPAFLTLNSYKGKADIRLNDPLTVALIKEFEKMIQVLREKRNDLTIKQNQI